MNSIRGVYCINAINSIISVCLGVPSFLVVVSNLFPLIAVIQVIPLIPLIA